MLIRYFCVFILPLFLISAGYCSEVKIEGKKGTWHLLVDGKPFYIKGAGCGLHEGRYGEDYLKMAYELGTNCVRTWGVDQATEEYLSKALKYGLKVSFGIWIDYATLNNDISFISGSYKRRREKEVLDYIRRFKDHPAILIWGVGNECIYFTESEEEKIALAKFLEELINKIHKIDPNHPVMYASSNYVELRYIKDYMPSLDIIGMNVYPSLRPCHGAWEYLEIDKPYILSEFGPPIVTQSIKDRNGVSVELKDKQKAIYYRELINQMYEFKGFNLGGFVHHLGETTQESMTWWNINYSLYKKYPYWTVYQLYSKKNVDNLPPVIEFMKLNKTKLKRGEFVEVQFLAQDPEEDALRYELKLSTAYEGILKYYVNEFIDTNVIEDGKGIIKMQVPLKKGVYRVYLFVYDDKGNVASSNKSISVE